MLWAPWRHPGECASWDHPRRRTPSQSTRVAEKGGKDIIHLTSSIKTSSTPLAINSRKISICYLTFFQILPPSVASLPPSHRHSLTYSLIHLLTYSCTYSLFPHLSLEAAVQIDEEGMSHSINCLKYSLLRFQTIDFISWNNVTLL